MVAPRYELECVASDAVVGRTLSRNKKTVEKIGLYNCCNQNASYHKRMK